MDRIKDLLHEIGVSLKKLALSIWTFVRTHWKACVAVLVVILLIMGLVIANNMRRFSNYTVKSSMTLDDADSTQYMSFQNNILRYGADGAFYTDVDGHMIWNETYEMDRPQVDVCQDYLILFDKSGTEIHLMSSQGNKNTIKTNLPIVDAKVASQGTVAVLMQQNDVGYIRLYNLDGNTLANGEVHLEKTGYPCAIALSADAQNLVLSLLDLNDGLVNTTLSFYNFGAAGKKAENNIVASYSYSDMVIPQLNYIEGGKLVAFGDSEIILFSAGNKPDVAKEIFPGAELKSIFCNDDRFGYIADATSEDGGTLTEVTCYNANGRKQYTSTVDMTYNRVSIMSNNEVALTNEGDVAIYSKYGVRKYKDTLETNVYDIIPQEGSRDYIFIRKGVMEQAKLR